ncbi:hypothetical protein COCON_G00173080 [Conger conger]|uniref:C2 domain-containing protein n=1 Tax=Conger conger TaxID=82655 RepID=A0A9Q1HSJ0_CONCO|nr:hypothetical protein COCON_G00173080 [Conger conger]
MVFVYDGRRSPALRPPSASLISLIAKHSLLFNKKFHRADRRRMTRGLEDGDHRLWPVLLPVLRQFHAAPSALLWNLLDRDTFSKSDPLCVLYTQGVETKQWREFGRTEVIDNTLNPDFVRKYILDYFFEEKQNLRFDLYDVDSKSPDLSKHDFLGQMFCTLGEIVGSPASRLEKPLGFPGLYGAGTPSFRSLDLLRVSSCLFLVPEYALTGVFQGHSPPMQRDRGCYLYPASPRSSHTESRLL